MIMRVNRVHGELLMTQEEHLQWASLEVEYSIQLKDTEMLQKDSVEDWLDHWLASKVEHLTQVNRNDSILHFCDGSSLCVNRAMIFSMIIL